MSPRVSLAWVCHNLTPNNLSRMCDLTSAQRNCHRTPETSSSRFLDTEDFLRPTFLSSDPVGGSGGMEAGKAQAHIKTSFLCFPVLPASFHLQSPAAAFHLQSPCALDQSLATLIHPPRIPCVETSHAHAPATPGCLQRIISLQLACLEFPP